MSPRIAFCGVVLGLATFAYLALVLMPALSPPGQQEPFPPCSLTSKYYQFTTKGAVEPVDRFLCLVLPFFVGATVGPIASWNWAEFLLTLLPVGIHALEASTTALRAFWVLLVPCFVTAIGQVVGISVMLPLLGIPFYALSGASKAALRETSTPVAWAVVIVSVLFSLPMVLFFAFPHGSDAWIWTATAFQILPPLMFLAPLPIAMCCKTPDEHRRPRAHAHSLLLFLYGLTAGACLLAHVLVSLKLGMDANWSVPTLMRFVHEAWDNLQVRFLLVDHGVSILAVALLVLLDGGLRGLLLVLFLTPFLSIGGAVSVFYARPHQLWFMAGKNKRE